MLGLVLACVTVPLRRSSSENSVINQYNENLRSIQHQEQNHDHHVLRYDDNDIFRCNSISSAHICVYDRHQPNIPPTNEIYPQETEYKPGELKYNRQEQDITVRNMDIS